MNRRFLWALLALAVAGVLGAAYYFAFGRARPGPEFVVDAERDVAPPPEDRGVRQTEFGDAVRGGVYSGTVVEAVGGAPIAHAHVLLIATDDDAKVSYVSLDAVGGGDVNDIPVFGAFRIAADAETDASGSFRLSGGDARVVALFAYEPGHGPGMKAHLRSQPLKPGPGHEIRLARAGAVDGTVVDAVTRAPVAGADVSIFLQHPANQTEEGTVPFTPTMSFARFQSFIVKQLGPRIWGIEPRGNDAALHLVTDRDGRFHLGPLMKEVQLEFVITHPEYAWTDTDAEVALERDNPGTDPNAKVLTRKRRTVVPPGETVSRTFELVKGKEISGTVTDENGVPFEDVDLHLEHVAQYSQHHWYRTHQRGARTDRAGKFRIAGLSWGPYVLRMTHPAFESKVFQPVPEGSNQTYRIPRGGWIEGTVTGGEGDRKDFVAELRLTRVGTNDGSVRRERLAVRDGKFVLEKVEPATYDVALSSGPLVAAPVRVEVKAGTAAIADLALRRGGGFRLTVRNSVGLPIDPVAANIEVVEGEGPARRAGSAVSREGVVTVEGLTSGTYRVAVRAQGYVEKTSDPFEVAPDSMTPLAPMTLLRHGVLRILSVKDAEGRIPSEGLLRDITIVAGDGTTLPAGALATGTVSVAPGTVVVRANYIDGRVSETRVEVAEGESVPVNVVLTPK